MKESIAEMDEMETLRLETELEKQRLSVASTTSATSNATTINNNNNSKSSNDLHLVNRDNRDSGITGDSLSTGGSHDQLTRHSAHGSSSSNASSGMANAKHYHQSNGTAVVLRKSAINNSLLDLTDPSEKLTRRGSVGSLDSGMSISFVQSGATPITGSAVTQRNSSDGHQNQNVSQHQTQQHSVSRVVSNGNNTTQPIVGTCNNCMNPVSAVPLPVGSNNHTSACYHHMHHHHYHHHHHNLHLQQGYQRHHNNTPGRTGAVTSSIGNNSAHSSNTVASITSALL